MRYRGDGECQTRNTKLRICSRPCSLSGWGLIPSEDPARGAVSASAFLGEPSSINNNSEDAGAEDDQFG